MSALTRTSARTSATTWVILAVVGVALALLSFSAGNYLLRLATTVCMYAVLAQSWNFIGGLAGYPSFATAAFFGLGAYTSAVLQARGVPTLVSWACAGPAAVAFAILIGGAILHLRGHYFAIASLIVVEMLRELVNGMPDFTGGGKGMNLPILHMSVAAGAQIFFYAMLALALACTAAAIVVHRSKLGFGLRCIQQNEDAADMVGVDTTRYKVAAYMLSALFCGTVGAAYASWTGYIDTNDSFSIIMTVKVPVMCLLGGPGTVLGPVIGTAAFTLLEEVFWANFLDYNRAILGAVIVLLIFFLPGGLLGLSYRELVARFAPVRWGKKVPT
jgi:branched-chain amino acid transport system permease protein